LIFHLEKKKMKNLILMKLLILLVLTPTFSINRDEKQSIVGKKVRIEILGGKRGDSYYTFASDLKKGLKSDFHLNIRNSDGVINTYNKMVENKRFYFGFFPENFLSKKFKEDYDAIKDFEIVLPMGQETIFLIVKKNSGINNLSDLNKTKFKFKDIFSYGFFNVFSKLKEYIKNNKKTIIIGTKKQRNNYTAKRIKKLINGTWHNEEIDVKRNLQSFVRGSKKADGIFIMGAEPLSILKKLNITYRDKIRIIALSDKRLQDSKIDNFIPYTIKAKTYSWANYDVNTYAIRTYLMINSMDKSFSEKREIKKFVNKVSEKYYLIKKRGHPSWKNISFKFESSPFPICETKHYFYLYSYNEDKKVSDNSCENTMFLSQLIHAEPHKQDSLKLIFKSKIRHSYCKNWKEKIKISSLNLLEREITNMRYETLNEYYKSRNRSVYKDVPINMKN